MVTEKTEKLAYTVEEAGERLGISRPSAYLAVKRGEIPTIKLGHRIIVPRVALERMLANAGQPVVK